LIDCKYVTVARRFDPIHTLDDQRHRPPAVDGARSLTDVGGLPICTVAVAQLLAIGWLRRASDARPCTDGDELPSIAQPMTAQAAAIDRIACFSRTVSEWCGSAIDPKHAVIDNRRRMKERRCIKPE
jgi:hypothetical protein